MIRILRAIWGIYGLVIFVVTLILAIICYFVIFTIADKKNAASIAHKYISRNWARTLFIFFGIRLKIKNKHLLKKEQTYVFVANHLSLARYSRRCNCNGTRFQIPCKRRIDKNSIDGLYYSELVYFC